METAIIAPWLVLTFVVAYIGTDRKIGAGWAFLWALALSPIIGFIIVAFSPSLLSLERYKVQKKLLNELATIRAIMEKSNNVQTEQQIEQTEEIAEATDPNKPAIDVSKLATWHYIKDGI